MIKVSADEKGRAEYIRRLGDLSIQGLHNRIEKLGKLAKQELNRWEKKDLEKEQAIVIAYALWVYGAEKFDHSILDGNWWHRTTQRGL